MKNNHRSNHIDSGSRNTGWRKRPVYKVKSSKIIKELKGRSYKAGRHKAYTLLGEKDLCLTVTTTKAGLRYTGRFVLCTEDL